MTWRFQKLATVAMMFLGCAVVQAADEQPLAPQYKADLTGSYQRSNALRCEVSLNGVWKVSLQPKAAAEPPKEDWGYVLVPSSWMTMTDFPVQGVEGFEAGAWNGQAKWKGKAAGDFPSAWYQRQFLVPADWRNSRIVLLFNRLSVSGTIFVNGQKVGSQNEWDAPQWDITPLVRFGQSNDLMVRVDAALSGDVTLYLGAEQTRKAKANAAVRGITQDVWLKRLPASTHIDDVFARPSVRQGELAVEVRLDNAADARGTARLRATVTELKGDAPVKTFESPAFELNGQAGQVVTFSTPWKDAVLWELDNPHRYRLTVSLLREEREIDRTAPLTFGFREVWIDGRDVMLNGKPVHARIFATGGTGFETLARPNIERFVAPYLAAGFNMLQLASERVGQQGGSASFYDETLELADERGLLVAMPIPSVRSVTWSQPAGRETWKKSAEVLVQRYRNHPSLVMWSMNFNLLGYPWDMSPYAWASGYVPSDAILSLGEKRAVAGESEAIVRRLDPTRVIYHHAGGNFGQVITSNFYPSWLPLQEREDYPAGWAKTGAKPVITVEHGSPCYLDFLRGRAQDYETVRWTEMVEAEYAAMYLGPSAYTMQEDEYLAIISDHATAERQNDADKYKVNQPYVWGYNMHWHEPVNALMEKLYLLSMRSWRTYGVTGMCPHDMEPALVGRRYEPWMGTADTNRYADVTAPGAKPRTTFRGKDYSHLSEFGQVMRKTQQPALAYVGGSAKDGFTAKDHAYFAGETVARQIVLVNDLRHDAVASVRWQLTLPSGEATGPHGEVSLTVPAGRSGFAAIEFAAPVVSQRTAYEVRLSVDGIPQEQLTVWSLPIQVWPKASPAKLSEPPVLIDPVGQTRAMLDHMGVSYRMSKDGADVGPAKVILIGRQAFQGGLPLSPEVFKAIDNGAALICFEQASLSAFGLRTHARGVRQAFVLPTDHAVTAGLKAEDLADWRGDASLLEPYPAPQGDDNYPEEPWRYGNRGTVASMMIEKPSAGAARPILECEYDLGYTPLLEMRQGRGRILFCQLELTLRSGIDPVATLLAERLLRYAQEPATATKPVMAVGDKDLPAYLKQLGVQLTTEAASAGVIVARGSLDPAQQSQLRQFAQKGGAVVLVGEQANRNPGWLGSPVATERQEYLRASPRGQSPLLAGVSVSDLFLKDKRRDALPVASATTELLADPGILARVAVGKGQAVLFAIDPAPYLQTKITPERNGRIYRKLSHALAMVIANADGAIRGVAESAASSAATADIPLPQLWRFSIDPNNEGGAKNWADPAFNDAAWRTLRVPGYWESQGVTDANPAFADSKHPYDGFAWYRCRVTIPKEYQGVPLALALGPIDDYDATYLNGRKIGQTGKETPAAYTTPRDYTLPPDLIRYGEENVIAVKVFDGLNRGGILGPEVKIHVKRTDNYPYLDAKPSWNPYQLKRW